MAKSKGKKENSKKSTPKKAAKSTAKTWYNFVPGEPAKEAIDSIKKFRDAGSEIPRTYGTVFSREAIYEYVRLGGYFEKLIKLKPALQENEEYVIGFLNKIVTDKTGSERLTFTLVPLIRNNKTGEITDRIDGKEYPLQAPVTKTKLTKNSDSNDPTDPNEDFADSGNMYP